MLPWTPLHGRRSAVSSPSGIGLWTRRISAIRKARVVTPAFVARPLGAQATGQPLESRVAVERGQGLVLGGAGLLRAASRPFRTRPWSRKELACPHRRGSGPRSLRPTFSCRQVRAGGSLAARGRSRLAPGVSSG
jgi:hypothetical protein